jgi:hypothetical protein
LSGRGCDEIEEFFLWAFELVGPDAPAVGDVAIGQ